MEPTNLTNEISRSLRDEMRSNNDGLRGDMADLRGDMAGLRGEVAVVREQQVHSEIRVATELVAVVGEIRALRDDLRGEGVRGPLDDHETRIEALEKRRR
jgi:hypothetical protein